MIRGVNGTPGVLNRRSTFGSVLRRTIDADRDEDEGEQRPDVAQVDDHGQGEQPGDQGRRRPVIQVQMCGVMCLGWTLANGAGSRPSRAMTMKMRTWP